MNGLSFEITSHPTTGRVHQTLDPILATLVSQDGEMIPNSYSAVVFLQDCTGSNRGAKINGKYEVIGRPN